VLNLHPISGDLDFVPVSKMQLTAIDTVLRTATRVDENRLRKREQDIVPLVLARMAAFREKAQRVLEGEAHELPPQDVLLLPESA
jgi:hypothetical protein